MRRGIVGLAPWLIKIMGLCSRRRPVKDTIRVFCGTSRVPSDDGSSVHIHIEDYGCGGEADGENRKKKSCDNQYHEIISNASHLGGETM
jgi:hypothetical protein